MTNITSFKVSPKAYFVRCNQGNNQGICDAKLSFDIDFIPQTGDDSWVEKALADMRSCLMSSTPIDGNGGK